ncbi:lymphocyte antigen 75-like [Hippoglossus hippoglossus]|uniref:lymphocyte antigen 75-like n=1 Tax=Hippoglossus hippoglossus TaxID=8267 RepID=UPI00148B7D00|nr:lymphocyte antigen 75-like [Hippoglossus hippoglossus]
MKVVCGVADLEKGGNWRLFSCEERKPFVCYSVPRCLTFSTCLLHQYHFVSDAMNWTEAQSYCRETYTDLATIENTEEMKKLNDTVSAAGYSSKVWIGLYSHIDWKWSDGFNESGAEYRRWESPDPNYNEANELCVVQTNSGTWQDYYCHEQSPFVCYRGTLEDSDFVLVNTAKNWSEAQRHCREHYTDLATVRNNADRTKIGNLITPRAWIGLYRDPQIYWSDGSNYSFSSWYQGHNPLGSMKVVCGVADLEKGGKWRLFSCEERKPFVCYSVPTVKTLVKVRVELQDSSVDLNDHAVKEQILKELHERLKEKGLSGVTLKWREKADGKVFHKEEKGSDKKKKTEL